MKKPARPKQHLIRNVLSGRARLHEIVITDLYVVQHGRWQMSRGRKPSESWCSDLNPRLAYKEARVSLEYALQSMEHREGIHDWADSIVKYVTALGEVREVNFGGVVMTVRPYDNPQKMIDDVSARMLPKFEHNGTVVEFDCGGSGIIETAHHLSQSVNEESVEKQKGQNKMPFEHIKKLVKEKPFHSTFGEPGTGKSFLVEALKDLPSCELVERPLLPFDPNLPAHIALSNQIDGVLTAMQALPLDASPDHVVLRQSGIEMVFDLGSGFPDLEARIPHEHPFTDAERAQILTEPQYQDSRPGAWTPSTIDHPLCPPGPFVPTQHHCPPENDK